MTPRVLVAGVGNIFRGDDAFGCEVVRRLLARPCPTGVRATDFGTRGHDLAYAILDGYDGVILVDATARGGEPGTLYTLEPDAGAAVGQASSLSPEGRQAGSLSHGGSRLPDTHGVDLPAVFRLVRAMGGTLPPLYLVGCEPAELGPDDEGAMGLSEAVAAAVEHAVVLVEALAANLLAGPRRA